MQQGDDLLVRCLPASIDDATLLRIFSTYGSVHSALVLGRCCTCNGSRASVRFTDAESAEWVRANLNGNVPEGLQTPVTVTTIDRDRPLLAAAIQVVAREFSEDNTGEDNAGQSRVAPAEVRSPLPPQPAECDLICFRISLYRMVLVRQTSGQRLKSRNAVRSQSYAE